MSNVSATIWLDDEVGEIRSRRIGDAVSIKVGDCTMFVREEDKAKDLITELARAIKLLKEISHDRLQVVRDNAQAS